MKWWAPLEGGVELDLAQQALQRSSLVEYAGELADSDALLLHRVAVTQGDGTILHRLVVDGDAGRGVPE